MEKLGWDSCGIILVTGDAYVVPGFSMAVIRPHAGRGRLSRASLPADWQSAPSLQGAGQANSVLGRRWQHDSMINRVPPTEDPQRRRLHSGDVAASAPTARGHRLPALPQGIQDSAHRPRWHPGSLHRALRLLGDKVPLHRGGRQLRPVAVRQRRAGSGRSGSPPHGASRRKKSPMCG